MRGWTKHLGWKLLSLVFGALVWHLVVDVKEVAISMPVNVQYRNVPPDMEIAGDHPEQLFMKVRGPAIRVSHEALSATALVLDLKDAHSPGEQTVVVTESELGLPPSVQLLRSVPSQVRFTLERHATKTVPVEVRFRTGPPAGYRIAAQRISPQTVQIAGPESHVAAVTAARTSDVDLRSTFGTAEFRVAAFVDDPQVRIEAPTQVSVNVTLEKLN